MPTETTLSAEEMNTVLQQRFATLRDARRRFANTDIAGELDAKNRYVVIRSGPKRFAFPLSQVTEVLPLDANQVGTLVPGAPPAFWGLLLVRGEVRPVFDIKQLLGVSAEETGEDAHILFVRDGDKDALVGFKTERVEGIERLTEPERPEGETAPSLPGRFVRRLYHDNTETPPIQIVDVSALLASLRGDAEPEPALSEREDQDALTDASASADALEE